MHTRITVILITALIPASLFGLATPVPGAHGFQTVSPSWAQGQQWHLEEDLRLGALEGGGPEQFGSIGAIAIDAGGRIYVLEALSQEVRVFGSDGTFAFTFGGRGEGPGEFGAGTDMAFGSSGNLWVTDPVANRYTSFTPDGAFVTSQPRRILGRSARGGFLSDGTYIDWAASFPEETPDIVAGPRILLHPIRLSASFQAVDTLPEIEFRQEMISDLGIPQIFFKARPEAFVARDGSVWFAGETGYQVFRRTLAGDTTLAIILDADPAKILEADRQSIRDNYRGRPDLLSAYLGALPDTKPIIHRILGDNAGHIYIVPEVRGVRAGTALDVFQESGEYQGRLVLPAPVGRTGLGPLQPIYATNDHIYYIVFDELEVPYLSRLIITRPS